MPKAPLTINDVKKLLMDNNVVSLTGDAEVRNGDEFWTKKDAESIWLCSGRLADVAGTRNLLAEFFNEPHE